jgi:hypothetical protein
MERISRVVVNVLLILALLNAALYYTPRIFPQPVRQVYADLFQPDPCLWPGAQKSSVSISVSTAVSTKLVSNVAGKTIMPCGFAATFAGTTAPTALFEYGTLTTNQCDTGTVVATGTMAGDTAAGNTIWMGNWNTTTFLAPSGATIASKDFCVVTAGTAPSLQGYLTYVIQSAKVAP